MAYLFDLDVFLGGGGTGLSLSSSVVTFLLGLLPFVFFVFIFALFEVDFVDVSAEVADVFFQGVYQEQVLLLRELHLANLYSVVFIPAANKNNDEDDSYRNGPVHYFEQTKEMAPVKASYAKGAPPVSKCWPAPSGASWNSATAAPELHT